MMTRNSKGIWAIGAVALTAIIACTPASQEEAETPAASPPVATTPPDVPASDITLQPDLADGVADSQPDFGGAWAAKVADCGEAAKTVTFTASAVTRMDGAGACTVSGIGEQHPTGRSAIYTVNAVCPSGATTKPTVFVLNFGASDTVMQLVTDDGPPQTLERCPPPE